MIDRFFDWYERDPIRAIIAIMVLLAVMLGSILFNAADAAPARVTLPTPATWQDRDTYTMGLGGTHKLCWNDSNPGIEFRINIYRYRAEDSVPRALVLGLNKAGWTADPAGGYCQTGLKPPKTGHWIYEAEICTLAAVPVCSDTITAACAAGTAPECAGAIGSTPRGWWMYVFLPAPTGVGT